MTILLSTISPDLQILCTLIFKRRLIKFLTVCQCSRSSSWLRIVGNVHNWIENWLNNRKQRVVNNGSASDWVPVTSGVPQSSVLGPVLFMICINDIDLGLNNFIAKFADDTKIGNSVISDRDRQSLQEDLRKISAWSDGWEMPFNVNKCHILGVGTKNKKKNM